MIYLRVLCALVLVTLVAGHARLIDPPSRSSMWRFGYGTPINYNDNELFCGGIGVQHNTNKGYCGVCGDAYDLPQPRPNEAGGKYAKGIIVKTYKVGQIINVTIDVTANHLGYFEFKICPHNNPTKIVSQECLDRYPLQRLNDMTYKYYVKAAYIGEVTVSLKLPTDVLCSQCVLQWQYRGENNWGTCEDGSQALGCGPQETFRACADVSITNDGIPITTSKEQDLLSRRPTMASSITTEAATTTKAPRTSMTGLQRKTTAESLTSRVADFDTTDLFTKEAQRTTTSQSTDNILIKNCRGLPEKLRLVPGLDYWCEVNCAVGHCPKDLCFC